ncbi:unnamed protein product [Psylliodes chrysocephalus]|uniref:Cuticle protein n=1 Tax=Psylliodes chrysocephalus TaxID=3402493 RepID=A0A9P0G8N8_9CUCU|nr:unnamed protein product [Psylliodes chrysocephala]
MGYINRWPFKKIIKVPRSADMSFKVISFAAFLAVAQAGFLPETYHAPLQYAAPIAKVAYSSAPAVSYSSVSAPVAYAAAPSYAKLAAPVAYAAPAQYAAPIAKVAYSSAPAVSYSSVSSPVAYAAAPSYAKLAAPVAYAAPAHYAAPAVSYAAPAYKVAAPVAYAAPVHKTIITEPEAPANYDFGYAVNDPQTGDSKSQQESRHGDVVQGSYSLVEADGSKRIVEYTADAHNGFNAVVHKEPAQVAVKAVVAKIAAPVQYAAPLSHGSYYH